jgi:hypothetical protein
MITAEFFEEHTNWVPDGNFEFGALRADVRQVLAASGATDLSRVASAPTITGSYSLAVACSTNTGNGDVIAVGWRAAAAAASVWSAAATTAFISAGWTSRLRLRFLNAASVVLAEHTADTTVDTRLEVEAKAAPAGTISVEAACVLRGSAAAGSATFDGVVMTDGPSAIAALDGDSGNARWNGLPGLSTAERLGDPDGLLEMLAWLPPAWYAVPS